jgi:hypothetical protein
MGRKKAVTTISPKKVERQKKTGPQCHDYNWTTLFLALMFNQREIVEEVARLKKLITDKGGLNGRSSYDELQFITNELEKLNVKARVLADLE